MIARGINDDILVPGPTKRIHQFARLLRDNGFTVVQSDVADAIRYLVICADHREPALRCSLRALFCCRRSEFARFDEVFDAYWHARVGTKRSIKRTGVSSRHRSVRGRDLNLRGGAKGLLDYLDWASDQNRKRDDSRDEIGTRPESHTRLAGASRSEAKELIDLGGNFDPDERNQLLALAERLGAKLRYRISRRRKASSRGNSIHFRRTMRHSIATGGLPVMLVRKHKKQPPVSIVSFVDVSGSMDPYSLFFTRFVHALTGSFSRGEAFIFHTRLVHVSRVFREANPEKMMAKLALLSQGWSGGTRIGEAISTFNNQYAKEMLGPRSIVLIMSDGYDTGSNQLLVDEIRQLRRRAHKLIWLNPLLGRENYRPQTAGMAAVRPYLDVFAPAHNLRSLSLLEDLLVRA